jgi:hypothetical protein
MKYMNIKFKFFIFSICLLFKLNPLFSQDFYINQESKASYLNYVISPQWIDLNQNESYEFLNKSGFTDIKTISNDNKEIVTGRISNKEYVFMRPRWRRFVTCAS